MSREFAYTTLTFFSSLLIFLFGLALMWLLFTYLVDVIQKKHAIRRNYPVIGRFRYFFEHLGKFFRQYFFAMDREELPFNRADRSWVYRAAKNISNTQAFGSSRDLRPVGTVYFINGPFPEPGQDVVKPEPVVIGPGCRHPYATASIFNISGMSYGALSRPAVMALAMGASKSGCWINTGEGGLSPYHEHGKPQIVFQIGTAKYGVRDGNGNLSLDRLRQLADMENVKMFEIKLSQGAKPGKGGILPGNKVTAEIAGIRGIAPGADSFSPNRHQDIANVEQLLQVVSMIRENTGKPVGFKCVIGSGDWLVQLCERVRQGADEAPDFICVDGAEGGSGASPASLMDYMGLPIRESLGLVVDILNHFQLKDRIKVIASGKLITPAEVAWALCMGADFVVSARGFMFALGCIQALQCNRNTCPTGITTHDARLQRGLDVPAKARRVYHYVRNMVHEVGMIAHACGVTEPRQLKRLHARIVAENGRSESLQDRVYWGPRG